MYLPQQCERGIFSKICLIKMYCLLCFKGVKNAPNQCTYHRLTYYLHNKHNLLAGILKRIDPFPHPPAQTKCKL